MNNISSYVILEPHIDDFELGALSFILKNAGAYKNEHTPVAMVSVITFCLGKDKKDRIDRFKKREKTIELLRRRGILVDWVCFPNAGFDLSLVDSKINDFCEYVNYYIKYNNTKKFIFMFPQEDLHNDHNVINKVGKILARRMFNKPVIEYIIWNSKDNPSIIPTNWNIEINLDENDKDILIDIGKIYKEDFDKLNNSNYNNKYNLIKYSL
jgi:hypothetical protein